MNYLRTVLAVSIGLAVAGLGPRADAQSETTLNVRNFGAVGNGIHDDLHAFRTTVAKAKASSTPMTIIVPRGKYLLRGGAESQPPRAAPAIGETGLVGERSPLLSISHANNFTLIGEDGAELIFGPPSHVGINVTQSKDVIIKGLAIDYAPLPFTQGIISKVLPPQNRIIITLDHGFDPPQGPAGYHGNVSHPLLVYTNGRMDYRFPPYQVTRARKLDGEKWALTLTGHRVSRLAAALGAHVVVENRIGSTPAVLVNDSQQVRLTDIHVFSSPSIAVALRNSSGVTLTHVSVAPPSGSQRLMSSNADGVHATSNRGGPVIENSTFAQQGDDGVFIGSPFASVTRLDSSGHGVVVNLLPDNAKVGDLLTFVSPCNGDVIGGTKIVKLVDSWEHHPQLSAVTLSSAAKALYSAIRVEGLSLNNGKRTAHGGQCGVEVVDSSLAGNGARIVHSVFSGNFARGILIRGGPAVVQDNTFTHMSGPAAWAGSELDTFHNGPGAHGLSIEGNTFDDIAEPAVVVGNWGRGYYRFVGGYSNENIRVSDNSFIGMQAPAWRRPAHLGAGIILMNVNGAVISANVFHVQTGAGGPSMIFVGSAKHVTIKDNRAAGAGGRAMCVPVTMSPQAERSTAKIQRC